MLGSTAAENLACTDEVKVYEDEGEEEEQQKSSENLTEDKVRLVIESETQIPRIFDFFGKNGGASLFKMPFPTDPRLASYFLPGYPAAIAAAMAAVNAASCSSANQANPSGAQTASSTFACPNATRTTSWSSCATTTITSVSAMLPSSCSCPSSNSCSVSCFWPGLPGQSSSAGSSSGSSSSGYASSEGSLSNGVNGPQPGWFHSAVSPGSLMNLSHYYSYPGGPQLSRSVTAAAAAAAAAAASASGVSDSHGGSSFGSYPDSTFTQPNITNAFTTSSTESVVPGETWSISSISSTYDGSLKDSMALHHQNLQQQQHTQNLSYVNNPFGFMPFYDPFGCAAAAAAYSQPTGPRSATTIGGEYKSNGQNTTGLGTDKSQFTLTNGKPNCLHDPSIFDSSDGSRLDDFMNAPATNWRKEGPRVSQNPLSMARGEIDVDHVGNRRMKPISTKIQSEISAYGGRSDLTRTSPGITTTCTSSSSSVSSTTLASPGWTSSQSMLNATTSHSNFYAAAAAAAAVAAAVASWSGSASSSQTTTTTTSNNQIEKQQYHDSTNPFLSGVQKSSGNSTVRLSSPANAAGNRSHTLSGSTSVCSPINSLPASSPSTSNLAAAAAVAAAAAATLPPAAFYPRSDLSRPSTSSNSTVASPYSPSMFAAAAAAHMQLLSAAAVAASFSSNLSSASSLSSSHSMSIPSTNKHNTVNPDRSPVPPIDTQLIADIGGPLSRNSAELGAHDTPGSNAPSTQMALSWRRHQVAAMATAMTASTINNLSSASPVSTRCVTSPMHSPGVWYRRGSGLSRGRGSRGGSVKSLSRTDNLSFTPSMDGDRGEEKQDEDNPIRCLGKRGGSIFAKGMHIKKPLNAFMLFMKEMRARVQEECTLKESAAINQVLGKKWHELTREEQTKYYEMARREKELHQQLYPNWSARDNYAYHARRRKRRRHLLHRHTLHSCSSRRSRLGLSVRCLGERMLTKTDLTELSDSKDPCSALMETDPGSCESTPTDPGLLRLDRSPSPLSGHLSKEIRCARGRRPSLPPLKSSSNSSLYTSSSLNKFTDDGESQRPHTPSTQQPLYFEVSYGSPSKDSDELKLERTVSCRPASAESEGRKHSLDAVSVIKSPGQMENWSTEPIEASPSSSQWKARPSSGHEFSSLSSISFPSSETAPQSKTLDEKVIHNATAIDVPYASHSLGYVRPHTTCSQEKTVSSYSKSSDFFRSRIAAAAVAKNASSALREEIPQPSPVSGPTPSRPPAPPPPPPPSHMLPSYFRHPYLVDSTSGKSLGGYNHPVSAMNSRLPPFCPPRLFGPRLPIGTSNGGGPPGIAELLSPGRFDYGSHLSAGRPGSSTITSSSSPGSVAAVAAAAAIAASELTGGSLKKCRARFGLEHQNMWCKPCRRKKKCIRFISDSDMEEFPLAPSHTSSQSAFDPSMRVAHHLVRHGFPGFIDSFHGSNDPNGHSGAGVRPFHSSIGFPPYSSRFPAFSPGALYPTMVQPANLASHSTLPVRSKISFPNPGGFFPVPPVTFHRDGPPLPNMLSSQMRNPSAVFGHGTSTGRDSYQLTRGMASFPSSISPKSMNHSSAQLSPSVGSDSHPVDCAEKSEGISRAWRSAKLPCADSNLIEETFTSKLFTPRPAHQSDATNMMRSSSDAPHFREHWSQNMGRPARPGHTFVQSPAAPTGHSCCSDLERSPLTDNDITHYKSENATDLSPRSRIVKSDISGDRRPVQSTGCFSQPTAIGSQSLSEGSSYTTFMNRPTDPIGFPPCKRTCDSPCTGSAKFRPSLSVGPLTTHPTSNPTDEEDDRRRTQVKSPSVVALNLKLTEPVRFGVAEFMAGPGPTRITQSKFVNGGTEKTVPLSSFSPPELTKSPRGDMTSTTA